MGSPHFEIFFAALVLVSFHKIYFFLFWSVIAIKLTLNTFSSFFANLENFEDFSVLKIDAFYWAVLFSITKFSLGLWEFCTNNLGPIGSAVTQFI